MNEFLTVVALIIVIEGLLYGAFPEQMKKGIEIILETPTNQIRFIALASAAVGLLALFFIKS